MSRIKLHLGILCLFSALFAAAADQPRELTGYVARKSVDCFNPECFHDEPKYFVVDDATGISVQLKGHDDLLRGVHPKQKVRVSTARNIPPRSAVAEDKTAPDPDSVPDRIADIELIPMVEEAMDEKPAFDRGGNDLTMLSTLLVFISTNTHTCMTSETNARGRLFNNTTNANLGMQAITKGRYGLQLGNGTGIPNDHVVQLTLDVNSVDHDSDSIESLALTKLFGSVASGNMGLTRLAWDRILLFAPGGITDSSFTAYGYYPSGSYTTKGMVTMYGSSYGNNRMNGYLHELGHNFGFAHSYKGTNEYGDRTCVMGLSNDGTRTETYGVSKLMSMDWLNAFPNAAISLSSDLTLDLHPLASDPNIVDQTIAVAITGTPYYVAYHRNQEPYGYLSQTGDRDRLFVYSKNAGLTQVSTQVANLGLGQSHTAGTSIIKLERYGPSNSHVTVSIDLADGNTKPVATNQSLSTNINAQLPITLTGTDADGNTLAYTVVTQPNNGSLSGTAPNLTYTPPNNFSGSTSFEFLVNDGKLSSFGVIAIIVANANNSPPVVNAGPDQTVEFQTSVPWTPPNLTTTGWYDASDALSITQSGNSVSQWADKSGNALHLAQGTADLRPKTGINTINGLTTVKFDGSNDTLVTTGNPFAPTIQDAFVIAVHRIDSTTVNGTLFSLSGSATNSARWQAHAPYGGGTLYFDTGGASAGTTRVTTSYGVTPGNNVLVGFQGSTTDGVQRVMKNGSLLIGDATGHSVGTVGNITVGSSAGTQYQNTSIGEFIIIKGTITTENRQKLEGYLAHKWGLAASLPVDHPYQSSAPGGSGTTVQLGGTVTDPDGGTPMTVWSKVSGPGTVTFGDASAVDTTATFSEAGTYLLRLTANDGSFTTLDEVIITVTRDTDDADGDGIADAWEILYFDEIDVIDGSADSDGDGVLDFFEYLYGSNPKSSADSGFRFVAEPNESGGAVVFRWEVLEGFELGVHYDVRFSTGLSDWDPLPVEHYMLQQTIQTGRTRLELNVTHDYGGKLFLRLIQP